MVRGDHILQNTPAADTRQLILIARENDGAFDVDLHISVSYGTNITAIVNSIAHRVRYVMEDMCDFKVREINTYVDGMKA